MDLGGPWPTVELVPLSAYSPAGSPAERLNEARAAQIVHRWEQRAQALDAAASDPALLDQVTAERAIDDVAHNRLEPALAAAQGVLATSTDPVARARALEAVGRVQLWSGVDTTARAGERTYTEVIDAYRQLGSAEWAGAALVWLGNAGHARRGDLVGAEARIREALDVLDPASPRRPSSLSFLVDVVQITGRWAECDAALDEAEALADRFGEHSRAYVAWSRARIACLRQDPLSTARAIKDVEHSFDEWALLSSGPTFLADAAAMLSRVGDPDLARTYLDRAAALDPDGEYVRMAEAELLARDGDPDEALAALRDVVHSEWTEVVERWRMTLLTAWASLRAGRTASAGEHAARAFAEADAMAGAVVAPSNEPRLTRLLAPLAVHHGSPPAARLLSGSGTVLQLFGRPQLSRDGDAIPLPRGLPGTLLRLVAVHEHGLDAEMVIDHLWPEHDLASGRKQLRTTLSRLNQPAGELVVREGNHLVLADIWVDVHAFRAIADQALSERRPDTVLAALALWTGEPLGTDVYADWARTFRGTTTRRHLRLLDLAADLLPERAEVFLEQAIEADPEDISRYEWLARLLDEGNRPEAASRWRALARAVAEHD